ncbi:MAG: PQQ-binding-like beta-propeller repeat protein [Blastocatellia bacterium]
MKRRPWIHLSFVAMFCVIYFVAAAQDWPQWRGPRRDGAVPAFKPPANWPAKLTRQWEVKIGEGYSSPVVAGDFVFFLSGEGILTIVKRGAAKFEPVAQYPVAGGKAWSQPVLLDNRILIRAASSLTLWSFE